LYSFYAEGATGGTPGTAAYAIAFAEDNLLALQAQYLSNVVPLNTGPLVGATTASGTGGGGTGGATGGSGCPALDMWLDDTVQVQDTFVGYRLSTLSGEIHNPRNLKQGTEEIQWLNHSDEICYRFRTENEAEVIVSESTPVPTLEGFDLETGFMAHEIRVGMHLMTDVGNGLEWSVCTVAEYVGIRTVARLYCGGFNFAAGTQKGKYIYTHNYKVAQGGGGK
jgi:hypothetical protein